MVNYEVTSVTTLNKYIWAELQSKLNWTLVNGKIPLTTANEGPGFEEAGKPYVVYTYTKLASPGTNWFIKQEQVTYRVVSENEAEIRKFLNLMEAALNRHDVTAKDVNDFKGGPQYRQANGNPTGVWPTGALPTGHEGRNIDFKTIYVYSAEGADAEESEGGRSDGVLTVRITYTQQPEPGTQPDYKAF